jgi:hypothetical protein
MVASPTGCGAPPRQRFDVPFVDPATHSVEASPVADHQSFATMLLRQIVGAHRALLQAEAAPEPERAQAVQVARQRLGLLVHQASVQYPSLREVTQDAAVPAAGR